MHRDTWFPIGHTLPLGATTTPAIHVGTDWQIQEPSKGWRVLIARMPLAERWQRDGLVDDVNIQKFQFGIEAFALIDGKHLPLEPLGLAYAPDTLEEALRGARAFCATQALSPDTPLQQGIYVAALLRFLPVYTPNEAGEPAHIFMSWLTGGVPVPLNATHRLRSLTSWADVDSIQRVLTTAGLSPLVNEADTLSVESKSPFKLHGRPELEKFFHDHVIDIVEHPQRYEVMGIGFPGAIALHGPPGCGKTFAVDKLVEFLGWRHYSIDASSIGSPYIHETGRKIASVFDEAAQSAPSVIIIDEMDAFLAERTSDTSGQHRVEEVAEFLKRLADAPKNKVLVIGMTNRIDAIDAAVLRRGRFDHVLKVDMASEEEIGALLESLISSLPNDAQVPLSDIARKLAGRPLSDVTFVVREAARRSAREGRSILSGEFVQAVVNDLISRNHLTQATSRVGFL